MLNFLQASDNPIHAYFFSQAKTLRNQRENRTWKPNLIRAGDFWSAGSPYAHALWRRCFGVQFESVVFSALRASLCKILISSFAHKIDFAHNFSVDFF